MLTDIHVSSAKAKGSPYKLSDGKGLYLHVTANGTRTWRYDYRLEGKRHTVVLGGYPGTSLKVARTRHLAARTAVAEGQHPLSPKQKLKADAAVRAKAALHAAQNSFRAVAWKYGLSLDTNSARTSQYCGSQCLARNGIFQRSN